MDVNDNSVNDSMKHEERRIPFENMIYVGDSLTDVPCMRLCVKSGGNAIGVYNKKETNFKSMLELLNNNRIHYFVEADYSKDSQIEKLVQQILLQCKYKHNLKVLSKQQKTQLLELKAKYDK